MRFFIGCVIVVVALLYGFHVVGITEGSISSTNGTRFFSFSALDRLASAGWVGKYVVLVVDFLFLLIGLNEMAGGRLVSAIWKEKAPK